MSEDDSKEKYTIEKMKKLLQDISTKNENLKQDNSDLSKENNNLNSQLYSLLNLLKKKDNQIVQSKERKKRLLLYKVFIRNDYCQREIIRNCFGILNKGRVKKKNVLKRTNEIKLNIKVKKNKNLNDIGIGDNNIKEGYYINKACDINLYYKDKKESKKAKNDNKIKCLYVNNIVNFSFLSIDKSDSQNIHQNTVNSLKSKENQLDFILKERKQTLKKETQESQCIIAKNKKFNINPTKLSINKTNFNYISTHNNSIKTQSKNSIIVNTIKFTYNAIYPKTTLKQNNTNQKNHNINILYILSNKINQIIFHIKSLFWLKLLSKISKSKIISAYNMCKQLLITTKLLSIIKSNESKIKKIYFSYYHSISLHYMIEEKDDIITQLSNSNQILESKINQFNETFKQYEKSSQSKKDQTERKLLVKIESLSNELNEKNSQYEKLKKLSNETTQELINSANQCSQMQTTIKQYSNEIKELTSENQELSDEISSLNETVVKLKSQISQNKNELDSKEKQYKNEITKQKSKYTNTETQIENLSAQIVKLQRDNAKIRSSNEDLLKCNEQLSNLIRNSKNFEIENVNLVSQLEQYKEICDEVTKKYQSLKKEYDELKELSEASKSDLIKALGEMEAYSEMLKSLEDKIKEAEDAKAKAENERDNALNDMKAVRQRYINILGESNKFK